MNKPQDLLATNVWIR